MQFAIGATPVTEDLEHLFWVCPAWDTQREFLLDKYSEVIPLLPPCTRWCGPVPRHCDFLPSDLFDAACFISRLQLMLISILRARDAAKQTQDCPPKEPGSPDKDAFVDVLPVE